MYYSPKLSFVNTIVINGRQCASPDFNRDYNRDLTFWSSVWSSVFPKSEDLTGDYGRKP